MEQLLLHLLGDYVLQNDWMAQNKTKSDKAAAIHALLYALPFVLIVPSTAAWMLIFWTHYFIDRYRLAVYWIRFYNKVPMAESGPFGFPKSKPDWLAGWLLFIIDNTMHLIINYAALRWF